MRRSGTFFLPAGRILVLSGSLLAVVICLGCDDSQTLTVDMPLHLEEHLDDATIIGSEMPADAPQPVEWHFDEPQPGWMATFPRPSQAAAGIRPAAISQTDDALQITLGPSTLYPNGMLIGGAHVDVPEWNHRDWAHVVIRARSSGPGNLSLAFNVWDREGDPIEGWPYPYEMQGGTPARLVGDSTVQTYQLSLEPGGPWEGLMEQFCLGIFAEEPLEVEILSITVVPADAAYAEEPVGIRHAERGNRYRRSVFVHTPAQLEYRVRVPDEARLDTGLGTLRSEPPTTFRVTVRPDGEQAETLLEESHDDRESWAQHSIDLSAYAGQVVTLSLEAESERAGSVALWGAPTLTGSRGYLLPNGWALTPAGRQIDVADLPMNIVAEPSGTHAFVLTSGYNQHAVAVFDLHSGRKVQELELDRAWLGLAYDEIRQRLYVSGGNRRAIEVLSYAPSQGSQPLSLLEPIELDSTLVDEAYVTGLALTGDAQRLLVCNGLGKSLIEIDPRSGQTRRTLNLDAVPYTALISRDQKTAYVSLWDSKQVAVVDLDAWSVVTRLPVGSHPNDMAMAIDGTRLFVANANSNSVSVLDLERREVVETIVTTLYPRAPEGSTPNALALTPDGRTLFVANADNNNIAWIDISEPGQSEVRGFIPTGWYPSSVAVTRDGARILVGNGKGAASNANVGWNRNPAPSQRQYFEYIGSVIRGSVSIIPTPHPDQLARYTRQVYRNTPYRDRLLEQTELKSPVPEVIPDEVGIPSKKIDYVIYIIKENRTYDQVLGDMPEGNGDSTLTLFGERVTPNHHALARDFALLDNFYVDAEVSQDGHSWSTAAYATDYTEKIWPAGYSGRGAMPQLAPGLFDPEAGFIWDLCAEAGLSHRSYGEFVKEVDGKVVGALPGLVGHVHPTYKRARSVEYTDLERADDWIEEFQRFEAEGRVPRFQVISLPDDHTSGTAPGQYTPFVQVARNDLGMARIIEAVSKSSLWPRAAIFVVEDDAQNGPDHVDAHRTVAFVVSPYSRIRKTESTFYTTSSMLRTMELILGLPPMSQYDAAATPMFEVFTGKFDPTPYEARPAQIDLTEKNSERAYGAAISKELPLGDVDEAPDDLFSEIIWKAVKGADSEMPAPVRRARLVPLAGRGPVGG